MSKPKCRHGIARDECAQCFNEFQIPVDAYLESRNSCQTQRLLDTVQANPRQTRDDAEQKTEIMTDEFDLLQAWHDLDCLDANSEPQYKITVLGVMRLTRHGARYLLLGGAYGYCADRAHMIRRLATLYTVPA